MKRILYLVICLVLILSCFYGCAEKSTKTVTYRYETKIYCANGGAWPCNGTEEWSKRDEEFISTACDVDMTNVTTDSHHPHYHYIVTKQVIDNIS